jgi:hypothetical protein
MKPSPDPRFAVEASVSLNCYFKRMPAGPDQAAR